MSPWRRARMPALVATLLVLVPVATVLLSATRSGDRALDPSSAAPTGTRALAHVLGAQGVGVQRVERISAARADLGAPGPATLVVTDPSLLAHARLRSLAQGATRVVLLAPDDATLATLAPALVTSAAPLTSDATTASAGCADPDARAAGTVTTTPGPPVRRAAHAPELDRVSICFEGAYATSTSGSDSRVVTAVTGTDALTNAHLAQHGNAALGLRALGATPRVVWLMASPLDAGASGHRSLVSLLPPWVGALSVQLLLVALAVVVWRGRRLGALVTEPLPVVVRAAETVEGRAALYRAADSPAASASALRAAARWRLAARLGLPAGAPAELVADRLGGQGGKDAWAVLLGPPPSDGAGLVALADALDRLEAPAPAPEPEPEQKQS